MTPRNLLLIAAILAAAAVSACGDDDTTSSNVPERFTQVGVIWHYDVIRSGFPAADTLQVAVAVVPPDHSGPRPSPDAIWQILYPGHLDSIYVYVSGDTLKIVPKYFNGLWPDSEYYLFPLRVGKRWVQNSCCGDTTRVAAYDSIMVAAGTFKAYRMDRNLYIPNDARSTTTWIDPEIGMVKLQHSEMWILFSAEWKLVSYVSPVPPFRSVTPSEP